MLTIHGMPNRSVTIPKAGDHEVEGCVFANVPPTSAVSMRGWVEAIRSFGYSVFARPKLGPEDDVDEDMLSHIFARAASHRLRQALTTPIPPAERPAHGAALASKELWRR